MDIDLVTPFVKHYDSRAALLIFSSSNFKRNNDAIFGDQSIRIVNLVRLALSHIYNTSCTDALYYISWILDPQGKNNLEMFSVCFEWLIKRDKDLAKKMIPFFVKIGGFEVVFKECLKYTCLVNTLVKYHLEQAKKVEQNPKAIKDYIEVISLLPKKGDIKVFGKECQELLPLYKDKYRKLFNDNNYISFCLRVKSFIKDDYCCGNDIQIKDIPFTTTKELKGLDFKKQKIINNRVLIIVETQSGRGGPFDDVELEILTNISSRKVMVTSFNKPMIRYNTLSGANRLVKKSNLPVFKVDVSLILRECIMKAKEGQFFPSTILIPMKIFCNPGWYDESDFFDLEEELREYGYTLPTIIFWFMDTSNDFSLRLGRYNVHYVCGLSSKTIKCIQKEKIPPSLTEILDNVIKNPRYHEITKINKK